MMMYQQQEAMQKMCKKFSRRAVGDSNDSAKTKGKKISYQCWEMLPCQISEHGKKDLKAMPVPQRFIQIVTWRQDKQ